MQLQTIALSASLLVASNVFMTFAWYAHLREQVPANRIGFTALSLRQLKIMQEAITLVVFVCIVAAAFFVFRG